MIQAGMRLLGEYLIARLRYARWRRKHPLAPCDVLLECADGDRGVLIEGRAYAQILDSYADLLRSQGLRCVTIAHPRARLFGGEAHGEVHALPLSFLLQGVCANCLDRALCHSSRSLWRDALAERYYRRLLRRVGCRSVVGIQPTPALSRAARGLGLPVLDLQHGDISSEVPAYCAAVQVSADANSQPTGYLVWNEESARVLRPWAEPRGAVVAVVGHPWVARYYRHTEGEADDFFAGQRGKASASFEAMPKLPRVLVTLQWGLKLRHPEYFDIEWLPVALGEAIRLDRRINWCLRLHPMTLREPAAVSMVEALARHHPNVCWRAPSQLALPAVLEFVALHVTWHSSSVIEACLFGIPSLVLSPVGYNYLGEGTPSGALPYAQYEHTGLISRLGRDLSAERISAWIGSQTSHQKEKPYENRAY
jgi:hypothetical protein